MNQSNTQFPSKKRRRAHPLLGPLGISCVLLVILAVTACWSWSKSQNANHSAQRAWSNVEQAHQAALKIRAYVPSMLEGEPGQVVGKLIDDALHNSRAEERSLRSRAFRSLGPVGGTGVLKNQVHLEFTGLTQAQAARIVDSLEQSGQPVSVELADLTAGVADHWDLTIELSWLQRPNVRLAQK